MSRSDLVTRIRVRDVDDKLPSKISPMPESLINVLMKEGILDLVSFLGIGYKLPDHLKHQVLPQPKN